MFYFAIFISLCDDVMVMSSVYIVNFTVACGVRLLDVYMLNHVGNRTPPCGIPVLNWRSF